MAAILLSLLARVASEPEALDRNILTMRWLNQCALPSALTPLVARMSCAVVVSAPVAELVLAADVSMLMETGTLTPDKATLLSRAQRYQLARCSLELRHQQQVVA